MNPKFRSAFWVGGKFCDEVVNMVINHRKI
jgi:hypothetical protein